ncbi:hypothetical protein ACFLQU_05300 [Verrucomicrobiota bacterium]
MCRHRSAPAVALLIFLAASAASMALEDFKFIRRQALELESPARMVSLGKEGFVVYDDDADVLVLLDAEELKETARVSLVEELKNTHKSVTDIKYNAALQQIFILDGRTRQAFVLDPKGKLVDTINLDISHPASLSKPVSIAIDAQGRIYVGDAGDDDIKAFTLQGTYLFAMHKPLDLDGKIQDFNPASLAVLATGSVAALEPEARAVVVFSRGGKYEGQTLLNGEFKKLQRLIVTETGEYLCTDVKQQKVYKWKSTGELAAAFGAKGTGRGKFRRLGDLAPDIKGNIIAIDEKNRELQIFTFKVLSFPLAPQTPGLSYSVALEEEKPIALALVKLLHDGMVLFDYKTKEVHLVQGDTKRTVKHPAFKKITAAYVGPKRVCFFDRSQRKVYVFDAKTLQFDFEFGGKGRGDGSLDEVTHIMPHKGTTWYLADAGAYKMQVFNKDGIFSTSFGSKGNLNPPDLGSIDDVIWYDGDLAILDRVRALIHIFDTNGKFIRNIAYQMPAMKIEVVSLAKDINGFLLLLDQRNSRMLVLNEEGRISFRLGSRGGRRMDWQEPTRVIINDSGRMRLSDLGKKPRILTYSMHTPGPLARARAAVDTRDWREVAVILKPYLSAPDNTSLVAMAGHERAVSLAMEAHIESKGRFLTEAQYKRTLAFLENRLRKHPRDRATRLALVRDLKARDLVEEAIVMLRQGHKLTPDNRFQVLQRAYLRELETSGKAKAIVSLERCSSAPLFAAVYQNYYDRPVVELTLSNEGGRPSAPGKALFMAKAVMDNATETTIPALEPFSSLTVKLRTTFNRNVLTYVEPTRLAAQIDVLLGEGGKGGRLKKNFTFQLLGRNSIDWKEEAMITCFITPKDPDVQVFARQALKTAAEQKLQTELDDHLYKALILFDAMQSVGLYYQPDPNQPFNFSEFTERGRIDYLQFPRETLTRQSGDCDDLSVLYASLLEGVGIPAVLVTSPGHIFAAFGLKHGKKSVDILGLSPDLLIEHKGAVYVPVETTLLGSPFISAWRVAANTVNKYRPKEQIGIIDLKEAWRNYKTVSLPPAERKAPLPKKDVLGKMLQRELMALNLKQVEKRLSIFKKWLKHEPKNLKLLMFLARSYSDVGIFDAAYEYAQAAMKVEPENAAVYQVLGNIAYTQNDYTQATEWFKKADKLAHTAPIQVNLALTYLKEGRLLEARKAYSEAKKLDLKLTSGYPELAQLLE